MHKLLLGHAKYICTKPVKVYSIRETVRQYGQMIIHAATKRLIDVIMAAVQHEDLLGKHFY